MKKIYIFVKKPFELLHEEKIYVFTVTHAFILFFWCPPFTFFMYEHNITYLLRTQSNKCRRHSFFITAFLLASYIHVSSNEKSVSAMINSRGVLGNFKWKSRLTSMLRNLLFNINKLYFFTLKLVINLHKILIAMLLSLSKLILMRGIFTIKAKWRVSEKITKIS